MEKILVALDWTPNTIHSGLLLATVQGLFSEAKLDVELISAEIDNYQKYPIHKLADGEVDIAMAPSEHVILHNLAHPENKVLAIAPIFQTDTSIMVAKKNRGFLRPANLDQKTFLGYHTHFEQEVLKAMIRHDGGKGEFSTQYPEKLSVWDAFLKDQGEVCWVFTSWEYAQASHSGLDLSIFRLSDYGVPYGYSPCLIIREAELESRNSSWKKFLQASAHGYRTSVDHPLETAQQLHKEVPHINFKDTEFLEYSLQLVKDAFLHKEGHWGRFDLKRWEQYLDWLVSSGLIDAKQNSLQPKDFMAHLW